NEAFLEKVRRVIADLGKMLADIDAAQQRETKPAPDADTLAALLEAARTFDVDAADEAMAALESYRYECGEELVAWLREELNHAGFAKIVGKLEQELKEIA
ncbi:MAG: hypothetical protein LBR00_02110, partial [Clostridiales Family XIII bacterium]|nr:hypothetical protein [Clostridiales Family XIII bacterium]